MLKEDHAFLMFALCQLPASQMLAVSLRSGITNCSPTHGIIITAGIERLVESISQKLLEFSPWVMPKFNKSWTSLLMI